MSQRTRFSIRGSEPGSWVEVDLKELDETFSDNDSEPSEPQSRRSSDIVDLGYRRSHAKTSPLGSSHATGAVAVIRVVLGETPTVDLNSA